MSRDENTLDSLIALGTTMLRAGDQIVVHADGCGAGPDGRLNWSLPCSCSPRTMVVQSGGDA